MVFPVIGSIGITFPSKSKFTRHWEKKHRVLSNKYLCSVIGCNDECRRKTVMKSPTSEDPASSVPPQETAHNPVETKKRQLSLQEYNYSEPREASMSRDLSLGPLDLSPSFQTRERSSRYVWPECVTA